MSNIHPIEYEYEEGTGNIKLPKGAPFDAKPVLIKLATGWCEAWWDVGGWTEGLEGREYSGWCWVCMDDQFQADLDDAKFWMPLPQEAA